MKNYHDRIAVLALLGAAACSGSAGNGARADSAASAAVAGATASDSMPAASRTPVGSASARTETAKRTRAEGFTIGGEIPGPRTVDSAAFAALPHVDVKATGHDGVPATYRGVRMSDVLSLGGLTFGATLRGPRMATYVVVSASDGYRAVFAVPELDSGFRDGGVYIADQKNGGALSPEEGPYRVVVPDEKRPARWVREVTGLSVRTAP
jgi:DMSO/TMAO reductase YedYZ molybdopterin-dependent catalytic subunit